MSDKLGAGFAIVGGIVGSYFGGPIGGMIGSMIGAMIDQAIFGGGDDQRGPRLQDKTVQTSQYGAELPTIWGTMMVAGEIIWAEDLIEEEVEQSGGKGAGSPSMTTFSYFADFCAVWCDAPIDGSGVSGILRIIADDEVIMDARASNTGPMYMPGVTLRNYMGTSTQPADPLHQSYVESENASAYRFVCTTVFEHLPVDRYGARIPNMRAEITNFTAAYPEVRVTDSLASPFMTLDLTRRILWTNQTGGRLQKIDALSYELLDEWTTFFSGEDIPTGEIYVDSFGEIYIAHGTSNPSVMGMYKVDPITMSVVGHIDLVPGLPQVARVALGYIAFDPVMVFAGEGTGVAIVQADSFEKLGTTLSLSDETQCVDVAIGTLGDIWTIAYDTAVATSFALYRLTQGPDGLTEQEHIDLTALMGTPITSLLVMAYDESENALLIQNGATLHKYDLDTRTITGSIALVANEIMFGEVIEGYIWTRIITGAALRKISVSAMAVEKSYSMGGYAGTGVSFRTIYDPVLNAVWEQRNPTEVLVQFLDRGTGGGVPLSVVLTDICSKVGLTADDIDVTEQTDDVVRGLVRARQMPARNLIDHLAPAYIFVPRESDYKMVFVQLGGVSDGSFIETDLGARQDTDEPPVLLSERRTQDIELPAAVTITYLNAEKDYAPGTQIYRRAPEAIASKNEMAYDLALALTDTEGLQIAERQCLIPWARRVHYEFTVQPQFIRFDPVDLVTVTKGGIPRTMLLEKTDQGRNGLIKLEGSSEDTSLYTSISIGAPASGATSLSIQWPAPTNLIPMDIPMVRDIDDDYGFYVAVGPGSTSGTWPGAVVYRSESLNTGFTPLVTVTTAGVVGRARTALGTTNGWAAWDRNNTVTVVLTSGSLSSATDNEVIAGANWAYLGGEIIAFANATQNADGSWTLSRLLRGKKGTEGARDDHAVGEDFVLLTDEQGIGNVVDGSSMVDQTSFLRANTIGSVNQGIGEAFTNTGSRKKPWAPCRVQSSRDGSGNITATFERRTRFGGHWKNGTNSIPLNEETESYSWDVLDGADVVRTITAATTGFSYSAADQVTDFGSAQSSVAVRGYMISAGVGRGFVRDATL